VSTRQRPILDISPIYDLWSWQEEAACRGVDTEKFFLNYGVRGEEKRKIEAEAIKICKTCPVIEQCRVWSLKVPEYYGVWGGLTSDQRMRLLKKRSVR
jgi:WhiB family redox-sensing transcriptional regulator